MRPGTARAAFVFIVLGLSLAINVNGDALAFLYIDRKALILTLAAVVLAGLIVYRNLLFATLVCGLVFATNQPPELLEAIRVSGDILRQTLAGLLLAPMFLGLMGFSSNIRPAAP
jgi:hypothetical protein